MMAALSLVAKATFILAAALLASRLIRRSGASTRALILTSALGALLTLPLMEVVLPSRPIEVELPRIASGLESVVAPLAGSPPTPEIVNSRVRGSAPAPSRLPQPATIVLVVWAVGVLLLLARLGAGLIRLRSLRRSGDGWGDSAAATILQQATSRRVQLFLHGSLTAPMTCGIVHPAIGLPIEARDWSATELRQALIHEIEHIRRADWLVLVISRVACSLYWFHPLAWIAARRLHLECEYACDDAVVRVGERASYAQQLVSLARRLSEGVTRPALSMADRRDLAKRVDAVLNHERPRTQLRSRTVAATTIAAVLITAAIAPWRPAAAQSGGAVEDVLPIPTALAGKAFSQVSIGPGDATGSPSASFDAKTGVFAARNVTLLGLISHAYAAMPRMELVAGEPYEINDTRIKGGPEWMQTERFDINAKANPLVTAEELHAMLRQLLRDSFDLSVRVETQQTPAYRMVRIGTAGSSAPGLQSGNQNCADRWNMEGGGPGHIVRRCITLAAFAADFTLSEVLGRPVIDRTGVGGVFNVSLVHAPTSDELAIYELSPSDLPREFFDRPSIFTAMEQQLGLRLESTRGVVHTLAIDSAARPTQIR
jgi:uncharacterized protein (TIGR03435 family)